MKTNEIIDDANNCLMVSIKEFEELEKRGVRMEVQNPIIRRLLEQKDKEWRERMVLMAKLMTLENMPRSLF